MFSAVAETLVACEILMNRLTCLCSSDGLIGLDAETVSEAVADEAENDGIFGLNRKGHYIKALPESFLLEMQVLFLKELSWGMSTH